MTPTVVFAVIVALFVLAIAAAWRDRRKIEDRVQGDLRFGESGQELRSTWRAPLSYRFSWMTGDVRVTSHEAFVLRSSPGGMPQPPLRLVLRAADDDRSAPGYAVEVTSMSAEPRGIVIEGRRGWATCTLRLASRTPERLLAALEAVRDRPATAPYRSPAR